MLQTISIMILLLLPLANSTFCSAYCAYGRYCNTQNPSICTSCVNPFTTSGTTCTPLYSYDEVVAQTSDSSLQVNKANSYSCGIYIGLYGSYTYAEMAMLSTSAPITQPHYRIKVVLYVLAEDGYSGLQEDFSLTFTSTTGSRNFIAITATNTFTTQCGSVTTDEFNYYSSIFVHSDTTNPLQIYLQHTYGSTAGDWSIVQAIVMVSKCHDYCNSCSSYLVTSCSSCVTNYVLYISTCQDACPAAWTQSTANPGNCIQCNSNCLNCTGIATACSLCITSATIYLSIDHNQCLTTCRTNQDYFKNSVSMTCQKCSQKCVGISIGVQQDLYGDSLTFTVTFNEEMDFGVYDYLNFQTISVDSSTTTKTINDFTISYNLVSNTSYEILVEAKNIQIDEGTKFLLTTKNYTVDEFTTEGNLLDSSIYNKIQIKTWKGIPQFDDPQFELMTQLTDFSNNYQDFITEKYVQEFNKAGIMNFLLPGAQMSSLVVVNKNGLSKNHYAVARMWSQFVYFDVPEYNQSSTKTKYVVSKEAGSIVFQDKSSSRLLSSSTPNSFARTGTSFYFLIDNYIQLILICTCWLALGIMLLLKKSCNCIKKRLQTFYFIFHKIHQISLFYIIMGVVLQFMNINQGSSLRWVSFSFSAATILYFMVYYFYVYYRIVRYPGINVSTELFYETAVKYGYFLDDVRYQEYRVIQWSWHHLLRPYNYRLMGFYKKMLIVCAMPLFCDFSMAQIVLLVVLQSLEIVRFLLTIPFNSTLKNLAYIFLQLTLLSYFISSLINQSISQPILDSNGDPDYDTYQTYYDSGRAAMVFVTIYNLGFLVVNIGEFIAYCCWGCRRRMESIRKEYYEKKLVEYQEYGQYYKILGKFKKLDDSQQKKKCSKSSYIELLNKLHKAKSTIDMSKQKSHIIDNIIKKGNLLQIQWQTLATIPIPIEQYEITKNQKDGIYQIKLTRVAQMKMKDKINYEAKNNVNVLCRVSHNFMLMDNNKKHGLYFGLIDGVYKRFVQSSSIESIFIKTYQQVDQNQFNPGERIFQDKQCLRQKVFLISKNHSIRTIELKDVLEGFPVELQVISNLL